MPQLVDWLFMKRPSKGSGAWSSYILHGPITNAELLWPRSTTGGVNNISSSCYCPNNGQLANGGVIYQGSGWSFALFTSSNGGQTWEIQNVIIPGMGSDFYTGFQGDTYEIVAKDNNIAILDW